MMTPPCPSTISVHAAAFNHVLANVMQQSADSALSLALQQNGCDDRIGDLICFSSLKHEINQLTYVTTEGAIIPVSSESCAMLHAFYAFVKIHSQPMNKLRTAQEFLALTQEEFNSYCLSHQFLEWYSSVPWNAYQATKPEPVPAPDSVIVHDHDQATVSVLEPHYISGNVVAVDPVMESDPAVAIPTKTEPGDMMPIHSPGSFPVYAIFFTSQSTRKQPSMKNNSNHHHDTLNGEDGIFKNINQTIYWLPTANIDWGPFLSSFLC